MLIAGVEGPADRIPSTREIRGRDCRKLCVWGVGVLLSLVLVIINTWILIVWDYCIYNVHVQSTTPGLTFSICF